MKALLCSLLLSAMLVGFGHATTTDPGDVTMEETTTDITETTIDITETTTDITETTTDITETTTDITDACLSSPCHDNACCLSVDGSFLCECHAGFEGDGLNCTDIDECDACEHNECHSNATCYNAVGSYACRCKDGFSGDGFTCEDIDECANEICTENAVCENTDGSFTCSCDEGYEGDGICSCSVINPCTLSEDIAADLCDDKHDICVQDVDDPAGFTCERCAPPKKADHAHLKCEHPGKGHGSSSSSSSSSSTYEEN